LVFSVGCSFKENRRGGGLRTSLGRGTPKGKKPYDKKE